MNQRYYSLDVFRGATVALMILVNNPGTWSHIYDPLEHAKWHGVTPTDLVFPFFLFAVGNALAFVIPRLEAAGEATFWRKVVKRSVLIFALGLLLHWFPFIKWDGDQIVARKLADLRIFGVLQRIAVSYLFAAVIVHLFKLKGSIILSVFILLAYWLLCIAANPADPYSLEGWFGTNIDKTVLGERHMYKGEGVPFDPEGLMSTFAAIVQVLFGYFAGYYIIKHGKTNQMLKVLFLAGAALTLVGFLWGFAFPLNKKIWTSSYTVYTSGLAMLILGVLIYLIEFRNIRGVASRFFDVFGKNALFIFILSGALPRLLGLIRIPNGFNETGEPKYLSPFGWFYHNVCKHIPGPPENGSLVYAIVMLLFYWFICYVMDKKKIYIKV
jgi:predicted acyltransferase